MILLHFSHQVLSLAQTFTITLLANAPPSPVPGLCLPSRNLCCPYPKSYVQIPFTSLKLPFRAVGLRTLLEIMSETERERVHHWLIFCAFLTGRSVFVGVKSSSLWPDLSTWHSAPSC